MILWVGCCIWGFEDGALVGGDGEGGLQWIFEGLVFGIWWLGAMVVVGSMGF